MVTYVNDYTCCSRHVTLETQELSLTWTCRWLSRKDLRNKVPGRAPPGSMAKNFLVANSEVPHKSRCHSLLSWARMKQGVWLCQPFWVPFNSLEMVKQGARWPEHPGLPPTVRCAPGGVT